MKITAVESILLTVPYRSSGGLNSIAGRPSAGLNMLLVRLETDDGVTGWGEAFGHGVCPATKTAFDTLVAPMLIGRDPSAIDATMHDLQQTLHLFGRSGAVMYALSGVDIALWDIAGKVAGKPLFELLGGADRALPAYASLLRCSGPDTVAASCTRALAQGYRQINRSVRIGGHSTSIQLEATFWKLLDEIAESQNMTTPRFISTLYDEALQAQGEIPNFASMLRTTCALYLRGVQTCAETVVVKNATLIGEHAA